MACLVLLQSTPSLAQDHSEHSDHPAPQTSPGPEMEAPPPPEAGDGPPHAADAIWGAAAMKASRSDLQKMHGDYSLFWLQADRAEVHARKGRDAYLWDAQGYYGGPTRRFWFKSEGDGSFGRKLEEFEVQGLYSQAVTPFFDMQIGVRQDLAGPKTSHIVVGGQGRLPYGFDTDVALFISHRGDVTARAEFELDQRITQTLIIQPRAEVELSAQNITKLGIGAGIDTINLGVRLRKEIKREFAPYIGIEQSWRVGKAADFAKAAGDKARATNLVAGVRFWF